MLRALALATVTAAATFATPAAAADPPVEAWLVNTAPATFDLHLRGTFVSCVHSEPLVGEVRLVHPKRALVGPTHGLLAVTIEDPIPANLCHAAADVAKEFRLRLDSRTSALEDPDAVHQLSPRFGEAYDVTVNGAPVGVLFVGISGLMALDPTP